MKNLLLITLVLGFSSSLFGQTWNAGTDFGVLVADADAQYSPGFTLTDNPTSISAVGNDAASSNISLWFNSPVDMSGLATNGATLTFTTNAGHAATTSFSISMLDSGFSLLGDISGFSFSDPEAVSTTLSSSGLNDVQNMVVNMGGIGDGVNIDITYFGLVPEPSTYALILAALVLGFVALRRN